MKNKWPLVFLLIPIVIVLYIFASNLFISNNAEEVKFKTVAYDPYDIIRGKYLNIQLDINTEIVIPEIQGPTADEVSDERNFIDYYKSLDETGKQKIKDEFKSFRELVKFFNDNGTEWYEYKDNSKYIAAYRTLKTYDDSLEYESQITKLINKMELFEKQGLDYFEFIENLDYKLMKKDEVSDYYWAFDKKPLYVYYTVDENGYANVTEYSYNKKDTDDNYIEAKGYTDTWDVNCIFSTRVNGTALEYFIDERLATKAEEAITEARNQGKEVVAVCKNMKGNLQIKQILIDDVDLLDYLK